MNQNLEDSEPWKTWTPDGTRLSTPSVLPDPGHFLISYTRAAQLESSFPTAPRSPASAARGEWTRRGENWEGSRLCPRYREGVRPQQRGFGPHPGLNPSSSVFHTDFFVFIIEGSLWQKRDKTQKLGFQS